MFLLTTMVKRKAQAKPSLISCDGAIDQIEISPDLNYGGGWGDDGYDGTIHWNIEVDGVLHVANAGKISGDDWIYMEDWIPENLSSILSSGYEDGIIIRNIDTVPHRIRLIPSSVPSESPIDIAENPTFNIDEQTGVISFCLANVERSEISCEGAIELVHLGGFYGCWTVLINGVPLNVPPYEVSIGTTIENWWSEIIGAVQEDGRTSLHYDGESHTVWRNNTNENIRIELIGLPNPDFPTDLTGIRDYFYNSPEEMNPTLLLENPLENNPEEFNKVSFCLAPSTCAAQGVDIIINRSIQLPAGTYYMEYQLNDGDWQRIEKTYSSQVHADDLGSSLFRIFDEDGWALIDTGGGGNGALDQDEFQEHPTPFESYRARNGIRASPLVPFYKPELAIRKSTTLRFRVSDGVGVDAVPMYFGGDVELHACTYGFWPGL